MIDIKRNTIRPKKRFGYRTTATYNKYACKYGNTDIKNSTKEIVIDNNKIVKEGITDVRTSR